MTAREYMARVRDAERKIRTLARQRDHLLEVATAVSASGEMVKSSPGSRVERAAVSIADLEAMIDAESAFYRELYEDAQRTLAQLKSQRARDVLTLRYMAGMAWADVAGAMGFQEEKSVFRLHGRALKMLQTILDGR